MFSSTALFKNITCPESITCSLLNCIFAHSFLADAEKDPGNTQRTSVPTKEHGNVAHSATSSRDDSPQDNRPRKRRRIDIDETNEATCFVGLQSQNPNLTLSGSPSHGPLSRETIQASREEYSQIPESLSTDEKFALIGKETIKKLSNDHRRSSEYEKSEIILKPRSKDPQTNDLRPTRNMLKISSEAVTQPHKSSVSQPSKEVTTESLNPRMIPNPPASHAIRIKLLVLLHQNITKLNNQTKLSNNPSNASLILSSQQLTTEALNIEVSVAEENPLVYQNVMKQRIMKYKKMTQKEWITERAAGNSTKGAPELKPDPGIRTGLSLKDELAFLPQMYADQTMLSAFGYITSAPTQQEIDAAVQGVEAAHNWEVCAHCETRFQVFPGRRPEDGVLTTRGRCRYHDGPFTNLNSGAEGFSCCFRTERANGCVDKDTHVFKVSDPKRLAAIMPFLETPENPARLCEEAVAFDCEMGYTTLGLELIRLTAISWPTGASLIDVLVRPLGEILDLNTKFSGVSQPQYAKALKATLLGSADYRPDTSGDEKELRMMESPAEARALLFKYITPTTPLIGHALENDLKAIRIIHPCIVDTVDLYPHRRGLPYRNRLRMLTEKVLQRNIQCSSDGHDSHEDARAAGDLVKAKIRDVVRIWKINGDKFGDGNFPPISGNLRTPLQSY